MPKRLSILWSISNMSGEIADAARKENERTMENTVKKRGLGRQDRRVDLSRQSPW